MTDRDYLTPIIPKETGRNDVGKKERKKKTHSAYVIKKQEMRQLLGEKCKKINIPPCVLKDPETRKLKRIWYFNLNILNLQFKFQKKLYKSSKTIRKKKNRYM